MTYRELAAQHPELMTECECRLAWLKSCGCISGSCPWCGDEGRRPKRLDELLTMLDEAGYGEFYLYMRRAGMWLASCGGWCDNPRFEAEGATRQEAVARLWMAVVGPGGADVSKCREGLSL